MLKAVMRGRKEEEVDPKFAGKLRMLIRQGLLLKRKIELAKLKLEEVTGKLMPYLKDLRLTTELSTATFRSDDGDVEAKFAEEIVWDEKDMPLIRAALGPEFSRYFHHIPNFAVNPEDIAEIREKLGKDFGRLVREWATFKHTDKLKDLLADGDSETGMKIRDFVRIDPKKPSVRFEESVAAQAGREAQAAEKKAEKAA